MSVVEFPAPVGGTALPVDFAPSIVFAGLYAALIPLMAHRLLRKSSRTTLLVPTFLVSIEHIVVFALRASQAHSEHRRLADGIVKYVQISFSTGYVGTVNVIILLTQLVLVNATYGSDTYPQSPAAATRSAKLAPPPPDTPDMPLLRAWVRRVSWFLQLVLLGATFTAIIGGVNFLEAFNSQSKADLVQNLRFASAAISLELTTLLFGAALISTVYLPRINKAGIAIVCVMSTLISTVAIYRLTVMHHKTTSLIDPPLNSHGAKAAFYIFHALPEWIVTLTLFFVSIKTKLGTGLHGDIRFRDETEEQRKKREAKEMERSGNGDAMEMNLI